MVTRIAMWSGPRNISTALMRSFGARPDTTVVDEPLYAHYLDVTGIDHPGREEILAGQPRDEAAAVAAMLGPVPGDVQYQKHMTHHLLPGMGTAWMGQVRNAFLIRDPARVIASYARVRAEPTLADLGFEQQVAIFRGFGGPVVDADALLRDPRGRLEALCAALGIPFRAAMLSWPAGPRDTDGVWAPYWYASVEASTGFGPPPAEPPVVPERFADLLARARECYDELAASAL